MAVTDDLADAIIYRDLTLNRLSESEKRRIWAMIERMSQDIAEKLADIDPSEPVRQTFRTRRLKKLQTEVDAVLRAGYGDINRSHQKTLTGLVSSESEYIKKAISNAAGVDLFRSLPTADEIKALLDDISIEGATVQEWWQRQALRTRETFRDQMRMGLLQNESMSDLMRRVRGTRENRFTDGIAGIQKRSAERIVRTATNSASNAARENMFRRNSDVIRGVQALVTLDSRTSSICIARSGGAWNIETGRPLPESKVRSMYPGSPPWHWRCVLPGTKIATKDGWKPIEEIRIDDEILTHRGRYRRVYAIAQKSKKPRVTIRIDTKTGRVLRTSNEHPILTNGRGWQRACDIKIGDKVVEYSKESVEATGSKVPLIEADNCPAFLDQRDVADELFRLSISPFVGLSIKFERNESGWIGEIYNPGINRELERGNNRATIQKIKHDSFMPRRVFTEKDRAFFHNPCQDTGIMGGVRSPHSVAVPFVIEASILCQSISPMLWPFRMFSFCSRNNTSLPLVSCVNPIFATPPFQSVIADFVLPLDFSKRSTIVPMFFLNKESEQLPVSEWNRHNETPCLSNEWLFSDIISIVEENSNDFLYELAIEDDETYIAEHILVHNCRTTLIPVLTEEKAADDLGFDRWASKQSAARQKEIFGPGRLELWKSGKISLTDLIDQQGRPRTLEQLQEVGT